MRTLSSLLLVSLSIVVAAPAAAATRVTGAAVPGVSDVLLNVRVAAPVVAWPNDSEQPGSVLVFHKFIRGTFNDVGASGQAVHATTELEISVLCPTDAICDRNQEIRLRAHWVCPGSAATTICAETSFDLETTVGGTLYFNPEGVVDILGVLTPAAYPSNATTTIPPPPCQRGYLIVWVVDGGGNAIKFDGLIGDVIIRDPQTNACSASGTVCSNQGYNALPIQAADWLATGDFTDQDGVGDLDFDDNEYRAVTGRIFGTVRYEKLTAPEAVRTDLTLLTLDVGSNRPNARTVVGLNFYTPDEQFVDVGTSFFCWTEQRLTTINSGLTTERMGRKGFVESTFAEQDGVAVTILGIVETKENFLLPNNVHRDFAYSLFNDGKPVPTSFRP